MRFMTCPSPFRTLLLLALTGLIYVFVFQAHIDKIQHGGDTVKQDISAEIVTRTLFAGDAAGVNGYAAHQFGQEFSIGPDNRFDSAVTDLKPFYFLYLALAKLLPLHIVTANFILCLGFLLASLYVMSLHHETPDRAGFVFAGSILLAPFFVYYSYAFEAHILQILFTCLSLLMIQRNRLGRAGFFLAASCLAHRSNFVLLLAVLLYLAFEHRKRLRAMLPFLLGGLAAWACAEVYLAVLFARDAQGLLPHTSYIGQFLTMSSTASGVAKSPSALNFFRNSLVFLLLPTVSLAWIRSPRQFACTTLPVILYFLLTGFKMPGVHRALLPIYFLAFTYFLHNCASVRRALPKALLAMLLLVSLASSVAYYAYALRCLRIDDRTAVALDPAAAEVGGETEAMTLRWNLLRYNRLEEAAPIRYSIAPIPLTQEPDIPDPHMFYPYLLVRALGASPLEKMTPALRSDPLASQTLLITKQVTGYSPATGQEP